MVSQIEGILKNIGAFAATFSEIGQHAPVQGIVRGVEAFNAAGADIIVSIGGGSPIDATKAIVHRLHLQNGDKFLNHIAIPTTLSAAEYRVSSSPTRTPINHSSHQGSAGYTDEQGNKVGVNGPMIAPAGVILDAELTLVTPQELWYASRLSFSSHAQHEVPTGYQRAFGL